MRLPTPTLLSALLLTGAVQIHTASAQTITPCYAGSYNLCDLGAVPGVPNRYGGRIGLRSVQRF